MDLSICCIHSGRTLAYFRWMQQRQNHKCDSTTGAKRKDRTQFPARGLFQIPYFVFCLRYCTGVI